MSTASLNACEVYPLSPGDAASIESRPATCPVCGSDGIVPRFRYQYVSSVQWDCSECGLGWLHPLPTDAELATFYPDEYYGKDGAKFRRSVEWLVRLVGARHVRFLTRRLSPGAAVLDIGCGRGVLLRELARRGFRAFGTERSAAAASGARDNAEVRICSRLSEASFDANSLDLVILWHVFEHLADPAETLKEIHRVLKPGGKVVIAVPNYSSWQARWSGPGWFHLDPPRHLFHFSIDALQRLLADRGFACRSWHHFSLRQSPFGWVQSALNQQGRQPRNGLYEWLKRRHRPADEREPFSRQLAYAAAFVVGMPIATLLEILATFCRQGATVHVVAEKLDQKELRTE